MSNDLMWALVTAVCLVPVGLWLVYGQYCEDTFYTGGRHVTKPPRIDTIQTIKD